MVPGQQELGVRAVSRCSLGSDMEPPHVWTGGRVSVGIVLPAESQCPRKSGHWVAPAWGFDSQGWKASPGKIGEQSVCPVQL